MRSNSYDERCGLTYFEQCFEVDRKIGAGSFGEVSSIHKASLFFSSIYGSIWTKKDVFSFPVQVQLYLVNFSHWPTAASSMSIILTEDGSGGGGRGAHAIRRCTQKCNGRRDCWWNYSMQKKSLSVQNFPSSAGVIEREIWQVFRVKSKDDNKWYAVKRTIQPFRSLRDRDLKLREVQKHELLPKHPNLVEFICAWEEEGRLFIQTELCEYR